MQKIAGIPPENCWTSTPPPPPHLHPLGTFLRMSQLSLCAQIKLCADENMFFFFFYNGGRRRRAGPSCINDAPSLGSLASIPAMLQAPCLTNEHAIPQVTTSILIPSMNHGTVYADQNKLKEKQRSMDDCCLEKSRRRMFEYSLNKLTENKCE